MADIAKDQVVDYLSNLPVIQIAELIKTLEVKWGVKAAPVAVAAAAAPAGGGAAAAPAEEKTEFTVVLKAGGANKIGPNLWNIVGDHQGEGRDGYQFSEALASLEGTWTYDELDKFLTSPKTYAPGTKMTFPGLKKQDDRADLIAWLRSLSASPQPLP